MNKPFILLVDDEPEMLRITAMLLKKHFKVYTAHNGKEALGVMGMIRVDCLITDINMPYMDGIELLGKMKDAGYRINTIVACAGDEAGLQGSLEELGVKGFIQKPYRFDDLISMINRVLSNVAEEEGMLSVPDLIMSANGGQHGHK